MERANFSQEKKPIIISREEYFAHCDLPVDSDELLQWMREKGIEFGDKVLTTGNEGSLVEVETSKEDFGTARMSKKEGE